MASMSNSDAYSIFYTADDLTTEGIPYVHLSLLTTSKTSGTIYPYDITGMRCDGVVEYCYEYNGIRLQGPNDAANTWNISKAVNLNYHPALQFTPQTQYYCFDSTY